QTGGSKVDRWLAAGSTRYRKMELPQRLPFVPLPDGGREKPAERDRNDDQTCPSEMRSHGLFLHPCNGLGQPRLIIPGAAGQATGPKTIIQSGRRLLFCRRSLIRRPVRRARSPVGWPIARANVRFGVRAEMKFDLPSETRRIFEQAGRFAEANLANRDRCIGLDRMGWRAAAEFGVFQLAAGPAGRGAGRGALASVAMLGGMGRGGADRGLLF